MKINKVKSLLITTSIITILSLATKSSISIAFTGKQNEESAQIKKATSSYAQEISNIVDNTNLENQEELESLVGQVRRTSELYAEESDYEAFQKATLVRVVDGDTIVVNINNEDFTVRLIGIDAPESVACEDYLEKSGKENSEAGKEASEYTSFLLSNYDYVYLQKDVSDEDRYGRLLRYVWLEVPTDEFDIGEIATEMLNGVLITEGYAEVATYYPDVMHEEDFEYLAEEYEYGY